MVKKHLVYLILALFIVLAAQASATTIVEQECIVKGGQGTCTILDKSYLIQHLGCPESIDGMRLNFSYDGGSELFTGLNNLEEHVLSDSTTFKVTGCPAMVYQVNLLLTREAEAVCGDEVCETGEEETCPDDCSPPVEETPSCEGAGYECVFARCGSLVTVEGYECPANYLCCKEFLDLSITPELTVSPSVVKKGDTLEVSVDLPYFADCDHYIINPQGTEMKSGSGGCGPEGVALGFSTLRLEQLFGQLDAGEWAVKIVAEKEGYDSIAVQGTFTMSITPTVIEEECIVNDGSGTCTVLDKTYTVQHWGCDGSTDPKNVKLHISYDGLSGQFTNLVYGSEVTLSDGTTVQVRGAPCVVYVINLLFKTEATAQCGNSICEVGEEQACPADCTETQEIPDDVEPEEEEEPSSTCSVGCLYKTSCVASGTRFTSTYCSVDGAIQSQLRSGDSCTNNYQCLTNFCMNGKCADPDECAADLDCNDGNPCTADTCEGIPRKCSNKETVAGCSHENNCIPIGTRIEGQFCSWDKSMQTQKTEATCDNDYECQSNLCVDSECVKMGLIQAFVRWLEKLFGL